MGIERALGFHCPSLSSCCASIPFWILHCHHCWSASSQSGPTVWSSSSPSQCRAAALLLQSSPVSAVKIKRIHQRQGQLACGRNLLWSFQCSEFEKIYDFKDCQNVTEVAIAHLMDLWLCGQVVRRSGILGVCWAS